MSEWQPIETAPKNCEIILAGRYVLTGNWDIKVGQWLIHRFPFVGQNQPSNWMPLPDPPQNALSDCRIEVVQLQQDADSPGLWIGFKNAADRDRAMRLFTTPASQRE